MREAPEKISCGEGGILSQTEFARISNNFHMYFLDENYQKKKHFVLFKEKYPQFVRQLSIQLNKEAADLRLYDPKEKFKENIYYLYLAYKLMREFVSSDRELFK